MFCKEELLLKRLLGEFRVREAVRERTEMKEQQQACGGGEEENVRGTAGTTPHKHRFHELLCMMISIEHGPQLRTERLGDFVKTED